MPAAPRQSSDIVLRASDIVKTFPGVRALHAVDFELKKGEIHALVGENGAGKSTLIHILAGVHQPDSGQVYLNRKPVAFPDPHRAAAAGIGVVFQELSLVASLSVAENIFAHRQPVGRLNLVDRRTLYEDTSPDHQQVVEILKALSQSPSVLILDEPTSSLAAAHVKRLFGILKDLKARGLSVIYISHHLREVFEVADRVTVLRDGRHVDTSSVGDVTEEDLVRKMVGREIIDMYGKGRVGPGMLSH
jgi:ABC-type sugar transport system ATPase subunit